MVWVGPSVTCSISRSAGTGTALLTNDVQARLRKCRLAIWKMATLIPAKKEQVSQFFLHLYQINRVQKHTWRQRGGQSETVWLLLARLTLAMLTVHIYQSI